ncbi:N-acetylglucosaminylphosphatidylinositol deacetylase [Sporobolomyces koalae]|uniref:N-acetylglucosaminylphosphatidylinositol deacetylase n=1 Tax=Sporobolomyces koalae TaxID=500713 RepID=UPI00317D0922
MLKRGPSSRFRTRLLRLFLSLVFAALLLLATHDRWQPWTISADLADARSVLWVTAHPDDESFFFAPSILNLPRAKRHLLCLSTGNHDGAGHLRQEEIRQSCAVLGIAESNCVALDHPELQDNPTDIWSADLVRREVHEWVRRWNIDAIITFDEYGVSGHANHRALYTSLRRGLEMPVYTVRSASVLAKYSSLVLLPAAFVQHLFSTLLVPSRKGTSFFASSLPSYSLARLSFAAHESQARWFRTLFVNASRYLWYVQVDRVLV